MKSFKFGALTSTKWDAQPGHNGTLLTTYQIWANDKLAQRGYLFLNEVLEMLGMPIIREGQQAGWVLGKWTSTVTFGMPKSVDFEKFLAGEVFSIELIFNCEDNILDQLFSEKKTSRSESLNET